VLVGLAAFSWLKAKRRGAETEGPSTLREAGLDQPRPGLQRTEPEPSELELEAEHGPLSRRGAAVSETLELDLDLDFAESPVTGHGAQRAAHMRDELGAHFLARATDALSPFGDTFAQRQFHPDQFSYEDGRLREASAKVANGDETLDHRSSKDVVVESERRPSATRGGGRK
jgi:hypothetical protein